MLNKQIKDNCKSVTFVLKSCKFIKQNMLKCLEELSSCLSSLEKIQLKDCEEGFIRLIPAFFTIASKKYHLRRMKFTFARKTTKDDVYNQEYIFEAKNCQLKIIDEFEDTEITVYADYYKVKIIDIVKSVEVSKEESPASFTFKSFISLEVNHITKVDILDRSATKLSSKSKSSVPSIVFILPRSQISCVSLSSLDLNISSFNFGGFSGAIFKVTDSALLLTPVFFQQLLNSKTIEMSFDLPFVGDELLTYLDSLKLIKGKIRRIELKMEGDRKVYEGVLKRICRFDGLRELMVKVDSEEYEERFKEMSEKVRKGELEREPEEEERKIVSKKGVDGKSKVSSGLKAINVKPFVQYAFA